MKTYDIIQINEFTYNLILNGENTFPIYQSIQKLLKTSYYDEDTNSIFFSAEQVISLKEKLIQIPTEQKMSHKICIKMIDDLTIQLNYLNKIGYGFYGFDLEDILTIDNTFIFCSSHYLLPLEKENIFFYAPIKKPYFLSPEIIELTSLPSNVYYKCVYYSLGLLVVFCLLNEELLVVNENKPINEIEKAIAPLSNTKIYWFLKRCFDEKIDKRKLLLI
jgi:hypothetical protein